MSAAAEARARVSQPATAALPAVLPLPQAAGLGARLGRNVAWTLGADLAARGASLWLAFFCARALPLAGFGLFALGQGVAQLGWVFGDAVVNNGYATREIARAGAGRAALASQLYTLRLATGVLLAAVMVAAIAVLPLPSEKRVVLFAATAFVVSYASYPDWLARGLENFRALSLSNLAVAAGTVALSVVLLRIAPHPALAALAWAGAFAIGTLVLLPLLARSGGLTLRLGLPRGTWSPHVRRSALFSLGAMAAMGITLLPTVLLGSLASVREVGLFASGFRLVTAVMGLGAVLWWPVYPALATARPASAAFQKVFDAFLSAMLALSLGAAIVLALFATPLLRLLFGADYGAGGRVLVVLACALPLQFLASVFEIALLASGGESTRARINTVALGVTLVAGALLAPRMGALGAALAFLLAIATALAGLGFVMWRCVSPRWIRGSGRKLALAASALALACLVARRLPPPGAWAVVALGLLSYAGLVLALGIVPAHAIPFALVRTRPRKQDTA